jgi:hypothetical protein
MGGQHYPIYMRQAAVEAYIRADGNLPEAIKKFKESVTAVGDRPPDANLFSFITYWQQRWRQHASVAHIPPPGQPPRMDDTTTRECIKVLLAGYKESGRQRYFSSMNDALKRSDYLREQAGKHGYNNATLLKRLKSEDPTLTRRMLRFINALPQHARNKRVAYCQQLLRIPLQERKQLLARIVWLDSKKLYVCPTDYLVYAPKDAQLLVSDPRLSGSSYDIKKINYYCAVNAVLGPVYFRLCTGTTGYKELTQRDPNLKLYMVGAAASLRASTS